MSACESKKETELDSKTERHMKSYHEMITVVQCGKLTGQKNIPINGIETSESLRNKENITPCCICMK